MLAYDKQCCHLDQRERSPDALAVFMRFITGIPPSTLRTSLRLFKSLHAI